MDGPRLSLRESAAEPAPPSCLCAQVSALCAEGRRLFQKVEGIQWKYEVSPSRASSLFLIIGANHWEKQEVKQANPAALFGK
jgi:hypothetical protein